MLTETDILRITSLFKQFGCNQREAEIYIHSLKNGPSTVQEIAHRLKCNRITVHSAIEQLIKKGLFYETRKGKRRLLAAGKPDSLNHLLQQKENELKLVKTNLDYVTELLSSVQSPDSSRPVVKFYEGTDGFKKMLEETLDAKSGVLVFTYVDLFSKLVGQDYLENYFKRRSAKNIYTKLIFPPCHFANRVHDKAKEYKIEVRLLPEGLEWKAGIFSWNNWIAIKSFTEGKITCTLIENVDIAYFYQNVIFPLCWEQAKPFPNEL
ncbi:MAG: Transcriptional regulator, TrmB [Candidatus Peregrinibacteria bacterium GW2011_GWA2_47_7]|nr:MAG: Transcriptional regulator, TrmB [Candidatus Peregrinibacteria bacterium GW2011_GWA2_47_7]